MATSGVPANYLLLNTQQTKNPVIVVKIQGLGDVLTNRPVYTRILYGDPGVVYGGAGLVYGGLRPYVNADGSTFRDYLSLDASSLTIGQRLEPEQGRASVTTLSLGFIDYQGYMTDLVTPGVLIPEILGAEVRVFLGYEEISYPQDFFEVFRGYVSGVDDGPGNIVLQLSDPNIKRRQNVFFMGQTVLVGDITDADTTITVGDTGNFFAPITGPDGGSSNRYSHCYIQIDDEWIECYPATDTTFTVVTRGARGTTAAAHTSGASVAAGFQLGDATNHPNAMDQALQVMLSGWNGPWTTGESLLSIGPDPDTDPSTTTTDYVILPQKVDAELDYGLVAGDYIILEGSAHSGNNGTYFKIVRFDSLDDQLNRIIYVDATLDKDTSGSATIGFRSQYDVLPILAGLSLTPKDVDIDQHIYVKQTFLNAPGNDLIFFMTSQQDSGKEFLESQVYFPIGAYSLTRRGKLSCGYHSPPVANQNIFFLDSSNVLEPQSIRMTRALNQRAFFNELDITYNYDDSGNALSSLVITDSDSLADPSDGGIGIVSALPIDAQGVYEGYSSDLLQKRAFFLLTRYKRGAVMFTVKVNWQIASLVETGDIVTFDDQGTLQIANFQTGDRAIDNQLFEVIDRSFDLKSGNATIKMVGGVGATLQDRFATISPSSVVVGGTSTTVVIEDSFGAIFPGDEAQKWENYIGLPILVHSPDYSVSAEVTLEDIDPTNRYQLLVNDLGFTPQPGYIVDIANYPDSTDATENALYKVMHCFWDPQVAVVSGSDNTHFDVGAGDIGKFHVGAPIRVHTQDYSSDSGDLTVLSISSDTIETSASMGFTPDNTFVIDLIGYPDFTTTGTTGEPYRFL